MNKILIILFLSLLFFSSKATDTTDSLLTELAKIKDYAVKTEIYENLITQFRYSIPDTAIWFGQQAVMLARSQNDKKTEADFLYSISKVYKTISLYDSALTYLEKSRVIRKAIKDTLGLSKSLNEIGSVYDNLDDYNTSISYYYQALALKKKLKDERGYGITLFNLGNSYKSKGDHKKAMNSYMQAREIFEKVNHEIGLAACLNSIGIIHKEWGNYDEALEYYNKAIELSVKLSYYPGMIDTYNNTGKLYADRQQYDVALNNFQKSLDISTKITDKKNEANALNNIGLIYNDREDYKKAETYFNKALQLAKSNELKDIEVKILYGVGYSLTYRGKCKEALPILLESLEKAEKIDLFQFIKENYIIISQAYMCTGDSKKAKEYYKKFSDALEANNKQLNDLRIKLETEKQEKEIELLNKQQELNKAKLETQEARMRSQRFVLYIGTFVLILILVFSVLITRQYRLKRKANIKLESQNEQIKHQKEEIESSINYAQKIQKAVLPPDDIARDILQDHFIIFKPKDIVSGDFYWIEQVDELIYLAVADCTGHGVPGAFMSMLGISFLNEIVRKKESVKSDFILNELRKDIIDALKQKGRTGEQKDGMDIALCILDTDTNICRFSGANNPLYILRHSKISEENEIKDISELIEEIRPDKMPVAIYEEMTDFTSHEIQLEEGDKLYMFSDGYADQFGGTKGKKFKYKPFKRLIVDTCNENMTDQGKIIEDAYNDWISGHDPNTNLKYEQIDDVTVIGIKI